MPQDATVATISHAIQLAVAPVFLLLAIGTLLTVFTNRLGRIVDRARRLEERVPSGATDVTRLNHELGTLSRRAKLVNRAITLCTITAVLIAALIAVLFLGAWMRFNSTGLIAEIFVAGMLALIAGLLTFLREIFLATANLRIGRQAVGGESERTGAAQRVPNRK